MHGLMPGCPGSEWPGVLAGGHITGVRVGVPRASGWVLSHPGDRIRHKYDPPYKFIYESYTYGSI